MYYGKWMIDCKILCKRGMSIKMLMFVRYILNMATNGNIWHPQGQSEVVTANSSRVLAEVFFCEMFPFSFDIKKKSKACCNQQNWRTKPLQFKNKTNKKLLPVAPAASPSNTKSPSCAFVCQSKHDCIKWIQMVSMLSQNQLIKQDID